MRSADRGHRCRRSRSDRDGSEFLPDGRGARPRARTRSRRTAPPCQGNAYAMNGTLARWMSRISLTCVLLAFAANAAGASRIHVEFWTMSLKPKFTSYFRTLVAQYEASNPNVELEWVDVPWDALQTKLTAANVA